MSDKATPDRREQGSQFLAEHYGLVLRLVRSVARRRRLSADDAEELRSLVLLKLVENDFAVGRKFEGRSSLATYLTKVIWRVWLDRRNAALVARVAPPQDERAPHHHRLEVGPPKARRTRQARTTRRRQEAVSDES